MAIYYLDTSGIVKRYRIEQGTEVIDKLLSDPLPQDEFYTSFLSIIELTSSIVRLARSGQLPEKAASQTIARFRQDIRDGFKVWPLDNEIAEGAVTIIEGHGLRSGDAIHMATARLIIAAVSYSPLVIVSSDRELLRAAKAIGIAVLDPQANGASETLHAIRMGDQTDI